MTSIPRIFETMEYGPSPDRSQLAVAWLERHGRSFDHFIGGEWSAPTDGGRFESRNPADQALLARISLGSADDIDRAVAAAHGSVGAWWSFGPHGRARVLHALARSIRKHAELLAVLETLDTGLPIRSPGDRKDPGAARQFDHHAGWARRLDREFPDMRPYGVVGQVTPRDAPLLVLASKMAPALAAGNTVVLKPSGSTSLAALLLSELSREAGVPPGVINVVTGDGRTGAALVTHAGVRRVAFTGSADVGREVRRATAGQRKHVTLGCGGPSPFLVHDDADLDSVVEGVVDAIGTSAGPVRGAGTRILAQEGIAGLLEEKLRARLKTLRIDSPPPDGIHMDPIDSPAPLDSARSPGDRARTGGAETHGPVVSVTTFRTPAESIEMAGHTPCGLAATIWTESVNLALEVAFAVRAGTVRVNCAPHDLDASFGFGGCRESGHGRGGGREGMWEYLQPSWEVGTARDPDPLGDHRPTSTVRDVGHAMVVRTAAGVHAGEVPRGDGTELLDGVQAAREALPGWAGRSAHERARILRRVAGALENRSREIVELLSEYGGLSRPAASLEVEAAVRRLFDHAATADTYDGRVRPALDRTLVMATVEPVGILAIGAPEAVPLLGLVSTLAPAIAMGNTVILVPSARLPLIRHPVDRVLDAAELPRGVVNLLAGRRMETMDGLAAHDEVDALWTFGTPAEAAMVEDRSVGNLKRCWVPRGRERNWLDDSEGAGEEFVREATRVKTIRVPYGA